MLLSWSTIDTVFLDMDGTLLDLHFDNYFWTEYLPNCYAQKNAISFEQAQELLFSHFDQCAGKLNWYCIDFWTRTLDLPVFKLKQEVAHLIKWRQQAELFLKTINQMNKEVVLITNAHPYSLNLKMQKVNLVPWFKHIISSHQYGYPKEDQLFWKTLQKETGFNATRSLFIDDSISVLRSAQKFGIGHLCAIYQPDSQRPPLPQDHEFLIIKDYADCFAKNINNG